MGQQVWTFNDITGTNYTIGLYHGEDSGHVIIYQNNNILIIDFNIVYTKHYHFYIGHELMILSILTNQEEFIYLLSVDTESNTPYNLQLKKNKKEEQQMIIIGQIVLIIFLIALFTYNYYFRYRK